MKSLFLIFALISFSAVAADSKSGSEKETAYPAASDIRCEKLIAHSLSEFKTKLVENCDLNKPYSSSLSRVLNDDTYFYCCQIKK